MGSRRLNNCATWIESQISKELKLRRGFFRCPSYAQLHTKHTNTHSLMGRAKKTSWGPVCRHILLYFYTCMDIKKHMYSMCITVGLRKHLALQSKKYLAHIAANYTNVWHHLPTLNQLPTVTKWEDLGRLNIN